MLYILDKPSKRLHPNAPLLICDESKSTQIKRVAVILFCSCFVALCGFADCDTCSAYKTQVANDCDAINGELRAIINLEVNIKNYASGILSQPNINATVQYNATRISDECTAIYNRSISAQNYVDSIKSTAQSLVCATNSVGSCDCSSLLEDLIDDLSDLSSEVHSIYLSEINQEGLLYQTYYNLTLALTELRNINTNISSYTNSFDSLVTSNSSIDSKLSTIIQLITTADTILSQSYLRIDDIATKFSTVFNAFNNNFWQFRDSHLTANSTMWSTSQFHFLSYNGQLGQAKSVMQNAIVADDFIRWIAQYFPLTVSSLNNYQYANYTNNAVVSRYLDHIQDYVSAPPAMLTNIVNNLRDFGNFFTNTTIRAQPNTAFDETPISCFLLLGDLNYITFDSSSSPFYSTSVRSAVQGMSFKDMVVNFSSGHFRLLSSLNNYAFRSVNFLGSIHQSLQDISNSITNFTLKTFDLPDRSPLDGVSSDYFAYLTNSYLSAYSGTNPNTNWFRRVEILLAALVFQSSADKGNANSVSNFVDKSSQRESLEDVIDTDSLFDYDFGSGFYETLPQLPQFGDELPQRLLLVVPKYGARSVSDGLLEIEIDVNDISTIANVIRACFRFLWWSLVAVLLFILGRIFLKGCFFAFKMIQGIHF